MELNSIVFPAPSCSYSPSDFKTLLFLPRHPASTIQSFTKCFESVQVKASILDEAEAKWQLSSRELTITKKFENNVKVKASILSNDKEKEIIKSFSNKQREERTITKKFENDFNAKAHMISSDKENKNLADEKKRLLEEDGIKSVFYQENGENKLSEESSRSGLRGRAISSYRSSNKEKEDFGFSNKEIEIFRSKFEKNQITTTNRNEKENNNKDTDFFKILKSKITNENLVEKVDERKNRTDKIPCLFTEWPNSGKLLLYFHGNAEDVGISKEFVDMICKNLRINALAVEYPGYGIYKGKCSSEQILMDAEYVYDYLTQIVKIDQENIIIFGRSIGSGPATHLAAIRKPGALILMSPYISIREIVKELAGSLAQYLIADRFRNIDKIIKVNCHTLFLHGKQDKLIPFEHSIKLKESLEKKKMNGIIIESHFGEFMTHNDFHFIHDLIKPLKDFFKKLPEKDNGKQDLYSKLPIDLFENNRDIDRSRSIIEYLLN